MLAVSVLGPVELRRDGERIPVRPGKTTEVLIRLALEAGTLVRTERLIEELWADGAATTDRNTLQTKVSRLRRALGDAAVVTGSSAGYTLEIEASAVDALEVPRLAASATRLLAAGDAESAFATCTAALAMFRGDVLCDAGDGDWLVPHRVRLEEVRLRLVEDQLAARIELGAAGEVIGELEGLVGAHPLREGLWALLITALYRDGRQADALAAYTRVRTHLGEELGLDPGPALRALETQVLQQDPLLERTSLRVSPGNLPVLTSTLVGRRVDLDELVRLVGDHRLVTMVGAAGVGKTRLAIEVARNVDRIAGAWLVRLETARGGVSVAQTIAAALNVAGGAEPTLLAHLRGSDALLVLDNCEHVVDAVAELVPRFLDTAPGLRVLCTSQLPLGIDGESVYPLEPLPIDDSIELFAQRATEQRKTFVLDADTAATVHDVCRSLDGLPLAIELAAARAKTLSVSEIARRLDDRFTLLRDPSNRRPERQRALAAAIGWSYDLLFPDDQRGLWALACFAGGAPLAAVEHVLGALDVPEASALDVVGRLADRSLVGVDVGDDGNVRYRLLDSVRAFGLDRLLEAGAADVAFTAHAAWFADAGARAADEVRGPGQARHLAFARVERANIDAALAWTCAHQPRVALRIVNGFGWAWVVIGDGALGGERLRAALTAAGDGAPAPERVCAWSVTAWLEAGNNVERAQAAAERAVEAAGASGAEYFGAVSRLALAFVFIQQARAREALDLLEACRAEFHRLGQAWDEGACCILSVHAALILGDAGLAASVCADAERLVRPLGDDWGVDHLDAVLGRLARAQRRFADAAVHLSRAAESSGRLGFATSEGYHLANLGRVLQQAGDHEAAVAALERAIEIGRATAEPRLAALARVHLGRVLRAAGEREAARAVLFEADQWYRSSGGGDGARLGECILAAMDAEDASADASAQLESVLGAARQENNVEVELLALDALARLHAQADQTAEARRFLESADRLMPAAQHLLDDSDRLDGNRARSLIDAADA